MALLSVHNVSKAFGGNQVLKGVNLDVHRGDKIGLVGSNGAGKTTLLNIITSREEADSGQITWAKDLRMGSLSQAGDFAAGTTLWQYLLDAAAEIVLLGRELARLESEMARPAVKDNAAALASLIDRYGRTAQLYEQKSGYTLHDRLRAVARGLGFSDAELQRPLEQFSGGEKTKARLAALLVKDPGLLLLDEPTNYLDADGVVWLESYLRNWPGALVVVSHDRFFLDTVTGKIALLDGGCLKVYRGNYTAFYSQRRAEEQSREKALKQQQAAIARERELIRTARGDERSQRQAQSREKRLRKVPPLAGVARRRQMGLSFGFAGRSSKIVVAFDNVAQNIGGTRLFSGASFEIRWGDRVALIGPNGAGKTTLLRMITGEQSPSAGRIRVGPGVIIGYFDQEQQKLPPTLPVVDVIMQAAEMTALEARSYLARYLFRGDDVFKRVAELSGGEKSRLALARVGLADSNFLILDEPTNHLDIEAREKLESTIVDYPGTLLVVSHDRYLIARAATCILELRGGKATFFRGTYGEFLASRADSAPAQAAPRRPERSEQKTEEKRRRELMLQSRRRRRNLEERLAAQEQVVQEQEKAVAQLEAKLADPGLYADYDNVRPVTRELEQARQKLADALREWENTAVELETYLQEEQ